MRSNQRFGVPAAKARARLPYSLGLGRSRMTVDTLSRILSVVAPLAVIIGVIIALLQLRNQQRLRQLEVVMRLYSSFGQGDFLRHYHRVANWKYKTYSAYRKKGTPDDYISLLVVSVFFENMGLLLKRKLAPIDLLDDLLSGPILEIWPKARPIWVGLREEHHHPAWAEWFEYFHDAMVHRMAQLDKTQSPKKNGAA
jgi:hypothetical protein